jgi:hypothetical protein
MISFIQNLMKRKLNNNKIYKIENNVNKVTK